MSNTEITKNLARIGKTNGPIVGDLNSFLYQDGLQTVLIDAGGKGALPGTGEMLTGLKEAGLTPGDVDTILCTHLHPDHIGGLVNEGGAVFPDAELHLNEADRVFWKDPENRERAPDEIKVFFDLACKVLEAYGDRTSTFTGENEIVSGILTIPLPGHTPGHTGFQIGCGEDGLLIWGDIVHAQAFQMPNPEVSIVFDIEADMATATRIAMFERAVNERLRIAGMHLSHPGVGYVVKDGDGFWFEPAS